MLGNDLFESVVTDEIADDVVITPPEEQEQKEAEQAFEAGLSRTLGEQEEEEVRQEEVKPTLFAGMTEDELKAVLDKANRVDALEERLNKLNKLNDKTFGTIGQFKQTLEELRSRPTGTGKPNISKETFKGLVEYFGDEGIAEALANDLSGVEYGEQSGASIGHTDLLSLREEIKAEMQAETDLKLLRIAHPDWEILITKDWEIVKTEQGEEQRRVFTDEFNAWTDTLKEDGKRAVFESNDPIALSNALTKFKAWKAKKEEQADEKRKRLEDGILVDGGSRQHSQPSDDAFNQGLKKVLGSKRVN